MGKIIIEKYQDDFKEEWQKAHLNEQTPGYRLYKLRGTQFQQGDNGIIFFDSLNEEDLKLEKAQENYILQEELYIVDRIYNEIGWEEFLSYRDNCYYKDMIKVFTDYYVPCGSADAQCSFYCPEYERCKGKCKEAIIDKFVAVGLENMQLESFLESC